MTGWKVEFSNETPKTFDKAGFEALEYTEINEVISVENIPLKLNLHKNDITMPMMIGEIRLFVINDKEVKFTVSGLSNGIYEFTEYFED